MKKRLLALVLVALLVQAAAIVIILTNPLLRRTHKLCRKSHIICMHAMDTERTAVGDTPVGWRDRSTGTSSATVQRDQSKYGTSTLKLVGAGSNQYGNIEKDDFVLPDIFAVEFAVRASNHAEHDQALVAQSVTGTEAWRYMPCSFISYFPPAGMGFGFGNAEVYRLTDSSVNTWYEVRIICNAGSNQVEAVYVDGVERLGGTRFGNSVTITSFCWRTSLFTAGTLWLDGFRVRKYVAPEPIQWWWGAEETVE